MSKFKAAGNAVLSGVKMERAAAGECVKVRRATRPRRPVGLLSIETPSAPDATPAENVGRDTLSDPLDTPTPSLRLTRAPDRDRHTSRTTRSPTPRPRRVSHAVPPSLPRTTTTTLPGGGSMSAALREGAERRSRRRRAVRRRGGLDVHLQPLLRERRAAEAVHVRLGVRPHEHAEGDLRGDGVAHRARRHGGV